MSVKPESLENAERDMGLMNRETKRKRDADAEAEAELTALRQRIAALLAAPPEVAPIPECRACYRKGWMAALQSLQE